MKVSESQCDEYLFSESYFRIRFGKIRKEAKKDGIMISTKQWVQFRKSAKEFLEKTMRKQASVHPFRVLKNETEPSRKKTSGRERKWPVYVL